MKQSSVHFPLILCSVLLISGCVNTPSKTTQKVTFEDSLDAQFSNQGSVTSNFTGQWILNKELSKNLQDTLKENIPKSNRGKGNKSTNKGSENGEHGGKSNGRKKGEGRSNNNKSNPGGRSLPQDLLALIKPPESLELLHEEPLLKVITKDSEEKIYTDFRPANVSSSQGMNQKITIAGWENNVLVIESTLNTGRIIQQYQLNPESGNLSITTHVLTAHSSNPIQFSSIYKIVNTEIEQVD